MSEDVSAGRLHLDAYIDTTGVTRGLQSRLDAEIAKIRVKIKAEVTTTGLAVSARKAAAEASKQATVKFRSEIDTAKLIVSARKAAEQASKTARITFRAELDTTDLADQVRIAAAEASNQATVKVRTELDQTSAAQTKAAVENVVGDTDKPITVPVDADTTEADAKLHATKSLADKIADDRIPIHVAVSEIDAATSIAELDAIADRRRTAEIKIDADTAAAKAKIDALKASSNGNFGKGAAKFGDSLSGFSKLPMIIGGIYTLGTACVQLVGGLFAVASAASQAVGALFALPNLAGIAVQGLGSLLIGLSGVGGAVAALGKKEATATQDATNYADAQRAAAQRIADARYALGQAIHQQADDEIASQRSIRDARRAVGDALKQQADDARSSAQAIQSAEYGLAQSHNDVRDAQIGLTDARKKAREEIAQLNKELKLSAGDEEVAMNAVLKAKEDLQDVNWDKASSTQERRAAQDALTEAENNLAHVRDRGAELAKDAKQANKKGVEGSDVVKGAKDTLSGALHSQRQAVVELANARRAAAASEIANNRAVAGAREALGQAQHDAADKARADAHAVADAQRSLADAQREAAKATTTATASQTALDEAFKHLSPEAKRFAKYVDGTLKPRMYKFRNAIAESLLPPLQKGIDNALPLLGTLETGMKGSAGRIGGFVERLGKQVGKVGFRADVGKIMKSNNRALGDFLPAIRSLVDVFRRIAVVAGPKLVEPFAKWVRQLTKGWSATLKSKKGIDSFGKFLDKARVRVTNLKNIIWHLVHALWGIGKAASPSGGKLLGDFEDTTKRWDEWANSDMGQKKMKKFFDAVAPVTTEIFELVGKLTEFLALAGGTSASSSLSFFKTLNWIMDGINKLMKIPGVGKFVGYMMMLAGAGGALGFVAGKILKLGTALGKVGKLGKHAWNGMKRVGNAAKATGKFAVRAGRQLGKALMGTVRQAGKAAKAVGGAAKAAGRWAKAAGRAAGKAAKMAWNGVVGGAKRAGKAMGTAAKAAGRWAKAAGRAAGKAAKMLWQKVAKGAKAAAGAVGRAAKAAGRYVAKAAVLVANLVRQGALWVAQKVKILAAKGAQLAMSAATKIAAGAQWLLNAAMSANPIGLIVLALVALVGIFILLYKKNKAFRELVQKVWATIKKAIHGAWVKVIKPALSKLMGFIRRLGRVFKWLWSNVVKPVWAAIRRAISFVWNNYYKPILKAIWKALQVLGKWFRWLWRHVVQPVWQKIREAIKYAWNNIIKPIWDKIKTALGWLGEKFRWLWRSIVKPMWENIRGAIKYAWNNVIQPIFEKIKTGISNVADAFRNAKDTIGRVWDKIKNKIKVPIKAVIGILNEWVIRKFNWLSGKLGGPQIPEISLKGFAEGGRVPGHSPHSRADNIPALLTADEEIIRQKSAKKMRREEPGVLEYINRYGKLPAQYALGGTVRAVVDAGKRAIDGIRRYAGGGTVWPTVGRATGTYSGHDGVDINQPPGPDKGAPIFAFRAGKISYVGSGRGYGVPAIFETGASFPEVVYGHAQRAIVAAGQSVRAGQTLGYVGDTGNAEGAHLHFGHPGGTYSQAMALLSGAKTAPSGGTGSAIGNAAGSVMSFLGSLGGKIGGLVTAPAKWLAGLIAKPVKGMLDKFGNTDMAKLVAGLPRKLIKYAGAKISSIFHHEKADYDKANPAVSGAYPGAGVEIPGGTGVARWGPMVTRVLGILNQPKSLVGTVLAQMSDESGGNPRIYNDWDSNWVAGHPSVGLMQVIRGTYAANKPHPDKGPYLYGVSTDPFSNIYAGLHYAMGRYGNLTNAFVGRKGYDSGGALYPGSTLAINRTGKTETVFTNENMVDMSKHLASAARALQGLITPPAAGGGSDRQALVGELTLVAKQAEMPAMLRDAEHQLRVIRAGGVHAKSKRI